MSTTDACMKFEQNLLKKKKVRACQRISSNSCHMPVILETPCCRTPNSKLFRDSNKSDVCLKFEQNPLRMKKVIVHKKKKLKALDRLYRPTGIIFSVTVRSF